MAVTIEVPESAAPALSGDVAVCRACMSRHDLRRAVIAIVWGDGFFVADQTTWEPKAHFAGGSGRASGSVTALFAEVASLLDLRRGGSDFDPVTGLGSLASPDLHAPYDYSIDDSSPASIDVSPVLRGIAEDLAHDDGVPVIVARFQEALVSIALRVALRIRRTHHLSDVILAGGAFRNERLADDVAAALTVAGFSVYRC